LLLHCAILWNPDQEFEETTKDYFALIKHILAVAPETLEKKSASGYTPLQTAVLINRKDVVAYLLSVGANQRTRDRLGRNVLHSLAPKNRTEKKMADIQSMVDLFDKNIVKEMLLERTSTASGALTPLAYWMSQGLAHNSDHIKLDFISLLTQHSTGEELEMINGEGDLPIHVVSLLYFVFHVAFLMGKIGNQKRSQHPNFPHPFT
jgi:hypothetical protein